MKLTFHNPGIDAMIGQILEFQQDGMAPFWSEPLYHFYPQLDRAHAATLPGAARRAYIAETLRQVYRSEAPILEEKIVRYAAHWERCRGLITEALSDAFGLDCDALLNDMTCHVSLNPIEPRFPEEHRFDLFYRLSERGAIGESIHEIIHLLWFRVWHHHFGDDWSEYEAPSLKWILSEMVVHPIMGDPRLIPLIPQYPDSCVYPYFYTMTIDGVSVLETLGSLYRQNSITDFMEATYLWCQHHEAELRAHIKAAEG